MIAKDLDCSEEDLRKLIKNEDYFDRNGTLINTIKLLNTIEKGVCISINGRWGSGKTVFVKQIKLLNEEEELYNDIPSGELYRNKSCLREFADKYSVFYYNAWANDDHEDPLQSILFSLISECNAINSLWDKIKNPLKIILKNFVKTATKDVINIDELKESEFVKIISDVITIEKKKEATIQIIDKIRENKKFLIILDELDRCNPAYAVKLLETVKHYFNNDNIVFLISTYNRALSHTVKKFYGSDFDGEGYLDKFYDLKIDLPEIDVSRYIAIKYSQGYPSIAEYFDMSLREADRYCSMLSIYSDRLFKINPEFMNIIPFALGLKVKDPRGFDLFMNGQKDKLIDYLSTENQIIRENTIQLYSKMMENKNDSMFKLFRDTVYLINAQNPIDPETN